MEEEYDEAQLGNTTCDHGLVMVYLKDTQQVRVFYGSTKLCHSKIQGINLIDFHKTTEIFPRLKTECIKLLS